MLENQSSTENKLEMMPNSNSVGLTPMMKQYLEIKEEYYEEILFYRMGDFYEMFFNDAKVASSVLDITLTKRGQWNNNDIPMCGIPFHSSESYLSKLISNGYKVALCEQFNDLENDIKKNKGPMKRKVVRVITPGTILEESFFDDNPNNFLCSWNEVNGSHSISWVDLSTGIFCVQKIDMNQSNAFETALERLSPRELLMPLKMKEKKPNYFKGCVTFQADSLFQSDVCEERLKKFYKIKSLVAFGEFSRSCISTAGAILGYVSLTQKGKLPLLKKIKQWKSIEVMEIDIFSRKSLELLKTQSGEKNGSLFNAINQTLTSGGTRLLLERLNGPSLDKLEINKRLDTVSNFVSENLLRKKIRDVLKLIPDIERSLSRIQFDRGGPRDLISIKTGCEKAYEISKLISDHDFTFPKKELNEVSKNLTIDIGFIKELDLAITESPPLFARDGNFIKKGFSNELDEIKLIRDNSREKILSLQLRYINQTGIQSLKIKFNNVLGYHLEVRKTHETKLLEQDEFIHRQGTAQASRFTTAELVNIESKLTDARFKSLNIELEIYESLVKNCLQRSEKLLSIFQGISSLDVAIGFAELAYKWNYSRPEISNERIFNVVSGRHPVIEQILNKEKDESFISNNCNLSDQIIWLITGPNMGGKSTFLRQNAIINIMAQMGSFVPAEKATIGISDRIFSRVGSGDDLSRGQSTFMVEMIETASILNHATEKSLVILDEIGRGTSTWDGLSLAWSIIEKLHNDLNCKTLFATHYHELTTLERSLKKLSLKTLEAKEYNDEIIFLYNLVNGSANKSYGLEVAKLAGVPFDVIKRAKAILKSLESDYKIDDKLPLFNDKKEKKAVTKISKKLDEIVPDSVSPIQALEILYELKRLNKNN